MERTLTTDQLAAVMLFRGSPQQQVDGFAYATGLAPPSHEYQKLRDALKLAEGRLEMLMNASLPGSDHPSATGYVLNKVREALKED